MSQQCQANLRRIARVGSRLGGTSLAKTACGNTPTWLCFPAPFGVADGRLQMRLNRPTLNHGCVSRHSARDGEGPHLARVGEVEGWWPRKHVPRYRAGPVDGAGATKELDSSGSVSDAATFATEAAGRSASLIRGRKTTARPTAPCPSRSPSGWDWRAELSRATVTFTWTPGPAAGVIDSSLYGWCIEDDHRDDSGRRHRHGSHDGARDGATTDDCTVTLTLARTDVWSGRSRVHRGRLGDGEPDPYGGLHQYAVAPGSPAAALCSAQRQTGGRFVLVRYGAAGGARGRESLVVVRTRPTRSRRSGRLGCRSGCRSSGCR